MRFTSFIYLLLLCVLVTPVAAEMRAFDPGQAVDLEADQLDYDQSLGLYHAQGHVRLQQGSLSLESDQLWWNQQTGEIEALGRVVFSRPGEELSGARVSYNLQQGTGVVEEGKAYWQKESLRLSGQKIERLGPEKFRLTNGHFTLCEAEKAPWSLGAERADLTIGRYVTARNAKVYLYDLPVFYTPYVTIPIKTERESGFLTPSVGSSSRRGYRLSTAWYQVLGRNMDATLSADMYSDVGDGLGLEYRYIFGAGQQGKMKAYRVMSTPNRNGSWFLRWKHTGKLAENWRLGVDVDFVDNRDFFALYGEDAAEYNRQQLVKSAFLERHGQQSNLTLIYRQTTDLEQNQDDLWQTVPELNYFVAPQRLGTTPLYFGLESAAHNFVQKGGNALQRLMLYPNLGLHRYLGAGLELNAVYGYRFRAYSDSDESHSQLLGSQDLNTRLSSRFSRRFKGSGSQWLHSVEPEISYTLVEESRPTTVEIDRFDLLERQRALGYALVNRLRSNWRDAEGRARSRETLWLKLSQEYDPERLPDDFSLLRAEMILRPADRMSFSADTYSDLEPLSLREMALAINVNDDKGNGLAATFHRRQATASQEEVKNLNLTIETSLLTPVYLHYEQRYDLRQKQSLEQLLNLEYRHQCWGFQLTLREREAEKSVVFSLSVRGIGQIASAGRELDPGVQ